jgi:hypothetical protein
MAASVPTVAPSNLRSAVHNPRGDGAGRQNTSDAVMAQRGTGETALDDFPTPPWATRALFAHVVRTDPLDETVLEPAANRGYMAEVLKEFFADVTAYDIEDYGYCPVLPGGFLESNVVEGSHDWVVTNPPFKLAEQFVRQALLVARRGVAVLCRTVIVEGRHRYDHLYNPQRPSIVAQFVERVPMVEGRVDAKASTATGYCWVVWDKLHPAPYQTYPSSSGILQSTFGWIPPCRKQLERPDDYTLPRERVR